MSKNRFRVQCPECGEWHWEEPLPPIDRSTLTEGELYLHDLFMKARLDMVMQPPLVTLEKLAGKKKEK